MKDVSPEDRPKVGQLVNDTRAEIEKVLEEKEKEKEAEEPKIKFFKSPIPEPKKHVSRVVDYDHEFNDELLKDYDIVVGDDDDYDILD